MLVPEEKHITRTHKKTGETHTFTLRPFRDGDEEAVALCVREEYGDTYYRREYYDREKLRHLISDGKIRLFMAFCEDEVCGIQSMISFAPRETRMEAATQIFRPKFRGYGVPLEMVQYTYAYARSLKPSCIYASTVVFHSITQRMCEHVGMVPVAFQFGSHLTSEMNNTFELGTSEKYAQAILILPVDGTVSGSVYVHPEIADTVTELYAQLGKQCDIVTDVPHPVPDTNVPTSLDVSTNYREQSIGVTVNTIGYDFEQVIGDIVSHHRGKYWTILLILPTDSPVSIAAYETLSALGFYFTGLRPLCGPREQIFMQYTNDVYFNFEEFQLTERFRKLLDSVLRHYKGAAKE